MRRLLSRTTLVAATIVTLGLPVAAPILEAQTVDSGAQTPRTHHRTPRRLILALVGAGVGAGLAGMYWAIGDNRSSPGSCTSRECVGIIMLSAGALSGYMIGREFDQLHEIRYRGGAPLTPSSVTASLAGEPLYLAVRDSVVAVAGTAGVQLFTAGASSLHEAGRRGTGVRGIEAVDVTPGAHARVAPPPSRRSATASGSASARGSRARRRRPTPRAAGRASTSASTWTRSCGTTLAVCSGASPTAPSSRCAPPATRSSG